MYGFVLMLLFIQKNGPKTSVSGPCEVDSERDLHFCDDNFEPAVALPILLGVIVRQWIG